VVSNRRVRRAATRPPREAGAALIVAQEQGDSKGEGVLKDYVLALFALPAARLLVYVLNAAR
jgi:hypothetical protein